MNQQLEESERLIADFGKQNTELKELRVVRSQVQGKDCGAKAGAVSRIDFKLRWREGEKAPCEMGTIYCDAIVHNVLNLAMSSRSQTPSLRLRCWHQCGLYYYIDDLLPHAPLELCCYWRCGQVFI